MSGDIFQLPSQPRFPNFQRGQLTDITEQEKFLLSELSPSALFLSFFLFKRVSKVTYRSNAGLTLGKGDLGFLICKTRGWTTFVIFVGSRIIWKRAFLNALNVAIGNS